MRLNTRFFLWGLFAISLAIVLFYTILPYLQTYYPPPASEKGWRKDTRPEFIQSLGIDPKKLDRWFEVVYEPPINPNWMSSLIIKDGWIIAEEYFFHQVRTKKLDMASIGKTVALTLFGAVLDDAANGHIDSNITLNSPLYDPDWLPQGFPLSDPLKRDIVFSHVLEHNSGLCPQLSGCTDVLENGQYKKTDMGWTNYVDWVVGHDAVRDRPKYLYFPPGKVEQFEGHNYWKGYSSVGFAHLGLVISNLYNKPVSEILESKLLSPIGVTDFEYTKPPSSKIKWYSAGGLGMTPRDFARFAYLLLKNGKWKNTQLIPESWMEELLQGRHYPNFATNKDYAFGERYPKDLFRLAGAGGTFAYIVPSLDMIAFRTNKNGSPGQLDRETKFLSVLFDAIEL